MPRPPLWRTGARRVYFSSRWTIRGGVRGEVHGYLVHVNHTTPRIYSVFTPDKTTPCGARSAVLQNAHVLRFWGSDKIGVALDPQERERGPDLIPKPPSPQTGRGCFYLHMRQAIKQLAPRLDLHVQSFWDVFEVQEQCRTKPTSHLEFFGVIPIAPSFFGIPIEPILMTREW